VDRQRRRRRLGGLPLRRHPAAVPASIPFTGCNIIVYAGLANETALLKRRQGSSILMKFCWLCLLAMVMNIARRPPQKSSEAALVAFPH
jgi:hypothetical protein